MSRTFLILPLVAAVLATSAMLAPATAQKTTPKTDATTIKGSKSNASQFKVTAVDKKANTFTAVINGQAFTFKRPKRGPLPEVGYVSDITFDATRNPGGPHSWASRSCCVKGSKSNSDN